ncbi:vesicle transport v-snare protein vti1 [Fistulina hepatica ATCC 64428]|uniref:Vesicle transport v-snare protein vti1 n=1 Tax=Fistulina hepatica ATCC 64428 TaxID=1128425 RepID=A0A0D7AFE4_9AGAR|nr:vesicle transport v-snare protein vti1 [Fistulina hepatica ATCC 64428]
MSEAALFSSYEQDFDVIIQSVVHRLDSTRQQISVEERKATLRKAELELDEADDIVNQLEVIVQTVPPSFKSPFTARLKDVKARLSTQKKVSKDLHTQANRVDLLCDGQYSRQAAYSTDNPYPTERTRLLAGVQTLEQGSGRLESSTRLALETEERGASILGALTAQREQIINAGNTLNQADEHIGRASVTIKGMIQQMYKQRVIYTAIGIFFVVLIAVILYFKIVGRRR